MKFIKKAFLFISLMAMGLNGFSQTHKDSSNIYGDWKCIKHDYRGVEKFTLKQAEAIRKAVLHIDANAWCFKHIAFPAKCRLYRWKLKPYQPYDVAMIDRVYTKAQLKQIFLLDPVNINGDDTCYNDCVILKKGNILITDCGGYIFYWAKLKAKRPGAA